MAPRMMVVCLGGLAGAGALVCCDMDEDPEVVDAAPEDAAEIAVEPDAEGEAQTVAIH